MAGRTRGLPAILRTRLIRELDQEITIAVRRTRDPRGVADAVVAFLQHFFTRESRSIRSLGDRDELAAGLNDRLERHHANRGLGPPGATLQFDGAWMLAQIDSLTGLRWEGIQPTPAAPPREAVVDPRLATAEPGDFRAYRPVDSFTVGELLAHAKFGNGHVVRVVDATKIEVRFAEGLRTLVQGLGRAHEPG